jgi:hypothetical protein
MDGRITERIKIVLGEERKKPVSEVYEISLSHHQAQKKKVKFPHNANTR